MIKNQLRDINESVTKIGQKGEVANSKLIDHSKKFEKRTIKITDGVYQVMGVGLANTTMIEGKTGMIIIDTGDGIEEAEEHLEMFREITDKPISAIIYTHRHYVMGTRAYVDEGQEDFIEIWGHERIDYNISSFKAELMMTTLKKGYIQLGVFLPPKGPDAYPNLALGSYFIDFEKGRTIGYVKPNRTVSQNFETVIDGINIEFIPSITDSDDGLTIWLPDKGVAVNNVIWGVFPNIGALRGDVRDPKHWINSIKDLRTLKPTYLLGVHGCPISGSKECEKAIEEYHDGMQFLYDQTVRGINLGLSQDELVDFVKLPSHLEESPILQTFYGEVANFVKGTYAYLMGWYGTDTATIHPVSKKVEAEKIIKGFGGIEKVVEEAQKAYDGKEYAWTAQLITYVLKVEPNYKLARQIKAGALRKLAEATLSVLTRNFYLTQVLELEGKISPNAKAVTSGTLLSSFNLVSSLNYLRVKLDPVKSENVKQVMNIILSDSSEELSLQVRKGLAEVVNVNTDAINPDITIQLTREYFAKLLTGEIALENVLSNHNMQVIKGNKEEVTNFFAMFDHIIIDNN
ncbi:alkyl sulfatase dimerization domain-containing protein [Neobacillus niacini]|uniref:alkyl sulfatase dimerization domain-containing protein n=1 Tax=Neobacillus niacini TaxID=86668 RepID=UPI001EE6C58B|nr:alkyl sulfatase dimerization domain-containing protein [Neobacillus niacini]